MDNDAASKNCRYCAQAIPAQALKCPHCLSRQPRALNRGAPARLLAGVCSGLADYLGMEPALVRLGFVLSIIFSGGLIFSAYIGLWFLTPPNETGTAPAYRLMDWLSDLFTPNERPRRPSSEAF